MAKLDELQLHRGRVTPLKLACVLLFLLATAGCGFYLVATPARQLYWGVYARVRPMVSERDLLLSGKEVQGGVIGASEAAQPGLAAAQQATGAADEPAIDSGSTEQAAKQPEQQVAEQKTEQQQQEAGPGGGTAAASPHALTKELVQRVAQDNMVVVTWANYHYRDFVMNWVEHLQATGCEAFIVGAMDDKLLEFLLDKKVPTFSMSSGLSLGDFGWGSPTFHKMGREKINLLHSFTKMGFDVLISDVDTVWLRNPLPYMKQYPDADILTSSDHLSNTVTDEGLELWPQAASAANIGIMLFRPRANALAKEWVEELEKDANVWDQNAFNQLFTRGAKPSEGSQRLFECYDNKLKCGILPVSIFCSGHTGFTQRMPDKLGFKPYVVHATFQFSGTPGKRHRMRERLWWNDPAPYFAHDKGFLVHDDPVPQALLDAARTVNRDVTLQATMPHFELVNYQLRQLRALFALATITGRAVILPALQCGMDRWWAPHGGIIPGSALELPYLCPADHVLELEAMTADLPEDQFGPAIAFREYSFLQNPQSADLIKSVVTLQVCQDAAKEGCVDSGDAGGGKLRPQLNEQQLKALLTQGQVAHAKVLRFTGGVERLFSGWADDAAAQRFKRRLDQYGTIWCCVNAHPGHVWYDFFHDKMPHTDRHGRLVEGKWQPITGP